MAEEEIPKAPPPPKESLPDTEPKAPSDTSSNMSLGNMTIVPVILIGAGILFIASALDNSSIVQTFQKIISQQPINWAGTVTTTGTQGTGTATTTTSTQTTKQPPKGTS